jgi:glucosamine--fructose-6-phosphate aminotransferase (isomerizing)
MEVCSRLEGAYALLIKSARYPHELVACKQGSPLVYGLKRRDAAGQPLLSGHHLVDAVGGRDQARGGGGGVELEVWLSSDSAALLSHTRDVVVR